MWQPYKFPDTIEEQLVICKAANKLREAGNKLYQKGELTEAAKLYEQVWPSGCPVEAVLDEQATAVGKHVCRDRQEIARTFCSGSIGAPCSSALFGPLVGATGARLHL